MRTRFRAAEPLFPGDQELERRIKSLIRWNALAMVVRAESRRTQHWRTYFDLCVRGHAVRSRIQSFLPREDTPSSKATRIYFQGHAAPGIYARAFMEGRISAQQLENFRRELKRAAACPPIRIPG